MEKSTQKTTDNKTMKEEKKLNEMREWALQHQEIARIIERLLDAGWLDHERISDLIASHLLENPYGINPAKNLQEIK